MRVRERATETCVRMRVRAHTAEHAKHAVHLEVRTAELMEHSEARTEEHSEARTVGCFNKVGCIGGIDTFGVGYDEVCW